jgi:HJR/Mrr/RecB family endonuclease
MARIFVSHSSQQTKAAHHLTALIAPFGHEVIHPEYSGTEERTIEPILNALASSDVVVALYDQQSQGAMFDLGLAFGMAKPLIVLISSGTSLPNELSNVTCVRVDELDEAAAYRILAAINNVAERTTRRDQGARRSKFSSISWAELGAIEFEKKITEWFAQSGAHITPPGKIGTSGYDFSVIDPKSRIRYVVEAKRMASSGLVSIEPVRQFLEAVIRMRANGGIFVTTSDFTNSARDFAERARKPILLWRTDDIDKWSLPVPSARRPL